MITNAWKLRRPCKKLRIRIISGHHLPKTSGKIKGNVIQPYVTLKIRGHVIDETEFSTDVVPKVKFHFSRKVDKNNHATCFTERFQSDLGMQYRILFSVS